MPYNKCICFETTAKNMSEDNFRQIFKEAYNNFDNRPLSGETLKRFYVDDFTKDAVDSIKTTIELSEKYRKMLVIGHRGCGKSTILNKVAEELDNEFYVVSFSVGETLNMNDVETIDILISIYLQLLEKMNEDNISNIFDHFNDTMKSIKRRFKIEQVGINLLKSITFKIKVENDSRKILREEFSNRIETLNNGISDAIDKINQFNKQKKEVLIIIDDLDKLIPEFAEKLFFQDSRLLLMPEAKILYTFPLETYYCEGFNIIKDLFEDEFISLVVVNEEKNSDVGIKQLEKVVLERIDQKYITEEALKNIVLASGGLLRDLIKIMRDACHNVVRTKGNNIDQDIAEKVINNIANTYKRLLDIPVQKDNIEEIMKTKQRDKIEKKDLIYLLKYLFVLEYRLQKDLWYDVHPCLEKYLKQINKDESITGERILSRIKNGIRNL